MSNINYLCEEVGGREYCFRSAALGGVNIDRWAVIFKNNAGVIAGVKIRKYVPLSMEYFSYMEFYLSVGVEYDNGYRFCEDTTKLSCSLKKGNEYYFLINIGLTTLEREIGLNPEEFSQVVRSKDWKRLEEILNNLAKKFISNTECDILP